MKRLGDLFRFKFRCISIVFSFTELFLGWFVLLFSRMCFSTIRGGIPWFGVYPVSGSTAQSVQQGGAGGPQHVRGLSLPEPVDSSQQHGTQTCHGEILSNKIKFFVSMSLNSFKKFPIVSTHRRDMMHELFRKNAHINKRTSYVLH